MSKSTAAEELIGVCTRAVAAVEAWYPTAAAVVVSEVEKRLGHEFGPVERPDRLAEAERNLRLMTSETSLRMRDALDELRRTFDVA